MTLTTLLFLTLVLGAIIQGQEDIRKPPIITEPTVAKPVFRRNGEPVTLKCKADGIPSPHYVWKWNENDIPPNYGISSNGRTGELTIKNLTTKNEGLFRCIATVTFGETDASAKSPEIEVRVARISGWNLKDLDPVTKDEGQYAELKCVDVPKSYSFTTFAWQVIEGKKQNELKMDDRMFIDNKGNLHFTYVKPSDSLGENNFYACGVSNEVSRTKVVGSNRKLTVNQLPRLDFIAPSTRFYTGMGPDGAKDLTFEVGTKGRLECVFSGYIPENANHLPTIEWFEGQQKIVSGQDRFTIEDNGHALNIAELKEYDEKTYECRVKENNVRARMALNVTSRPVFLRPFMSHQTVTQGTNAVFNCESRSASGEMSPEPPIWERNGKRLDLTYDVGKFAFEKGKTRLIVKRVSKKKDIACFQCFVKNSVGESTASACLNVVLPIEILTEPPKKQKIEEGDIVDLSVSAKSDPLFNLTYEWYFKGQKYGGGKAPPYVQYNVTSKIAIINTTGFTDEQMHNISGLYSRLVYHSVESINITTEVQFKKEIPPPPVAAAGFDYWIIVIIIIIVIFIILIIVICCVICRRKMLEGDYPVDKKETAAGLDPEKELKDSGFHDLSRADYDYYPEKKGGPAMDFDDIPIGEGDDESFGSAEYGDDAMAFTENGSFIGAYSKNKKGSGPPAYQQATESNV